MRNRPYELGLIAGRLGHRPANGFLTPWARRRYAQGYADGRDHLIATRAWWARQQETAA